MWNMFVHFPVTLFLLYSLFEIVRVRIIKRQVWYFYVKAILVILGACASYPTIITGIIAKTLLGSNIVINIHETFAITTSVWFSIIAFFYILGWIRRSGHPLSSRLVYSRFWKTMFTIELHITEQSLGILLAIIGAALISTTGAIGGLIAYGPDNDPVSHILYQIIY
jgi:uncharacterized membrane protein